MKKKELRTRCPMPEIHAMEAYWRPELGSTRALWTCVGLAKYRDNEEKRGLKKKKEKKSMKL
jgi:hypothetical protein